ncbi:ABC transporter substrate-binding protein [Oryzihumus leptocrescens]|uniref:Osmoprotectant transport system substrate-binding protein n=1 Tax=Oryzihumus leptocrescens TaxID=297536 RepID=A0A542Z953_9MICO|nr:ABC transporter substrate-binding protein [Oryzihumus leptocrescens]TQL56873.1 osmoprotectant transport system substrate-binding protein [Oryzihumus leptocrescens]
MKRPKIVLALTASAAMLSVAACGGTSSNPLSTNTAAGGSSASASGSIVVGSANFPENQLLAEIYAGALEAKGLKVAKKLNIGSREVYIPALQQGAIDLIPEYTGVLSQYFNKNAKATDADGVYNELKAALPSTLTVLAKSAAEDKDAVVVTKDTANKYHLKSIADLQAHAKDLTLGGPPEWKTRPTGVPGLKKLYNLDFKSFRALDTGGPLTVNALKNGQVDAADLFTTDPSIAANSFVILDDPKHLFAAQNVVPLITKAKVTDTISSALNAVSAKLDTATLGELVKEVVVDKKDAAVVAKEFLSKNSLG